MDYQKDTKNTDTNSYGQSNVSGNKLLVNKDIYEYSYKKTEKLITALYMVTDCMETDDALKGKVRSLGINLLSYIHKLSFTYSSPVDNRTAISDSLMYIGEILSLIGIANNIGFISDMNYTILSKELISLAGELKSNQSKENHFTFTLNDKMFDIPRPSTDLPENKSFTGIKDNSAITDKRTQYNNMSFTNKNDYKPLSLTKKTENSHSHLVSKKDRTDKILNIIKDLTIKQTSKKSALNNTPAGISIKDISISFPDYSEKTIQRELNTLVAKNQIKKIGAKRWSRYLAITR
ncbi:MAG: hypothetical protein KGI58_00910 [Patescibacteria group bacterium]|nr:hypothetical protein [Patescibacteria group bacterium]